MKVGIVGGAGLVGSTAAFYLGIQNIVSEIVLIDVKENMLLAHCWDMEQAVMSVSNTRISKGDWVDLVGCDIVIHCASVNEAKAKSRDDCLDANLKIIKDTTQYIVKYCPNAIIITAANPVDVLNFAFYKYSGLPSNHFVGFSRNDSLRLKWAIAKMENVNYEQVNAMSIGEHGFMTVPLFSDIKVCGNKRIYDKEQETAIKDMIINYFIRYQALDSGRSSGWTTGVSVIEVCKQVILGGSEPVACSTILSGQYGLNDISIGVPVYLGKNGIEKIVEIEMSEFEQESFNNAAKKIKMNTERVLH